MLTPQSASIWQQTTNPSTAPLRILHFVPRVSWPLNTGAKLRNYYLARELARSAHLTFLGFVDDSARELNQTNSRPANNPRPEPDADSNKQPAAASIGTQLEEPENFYERMITIERARGYTLSKVIRGALGRTPLPVLNYTTGAMAQALAQTLCEQQFDLVQVESIHLAAYLPIIRAADHCPLVVCDWHNIESELMWRYSERATLLRRVYARQTSRRLGALERRAMHEFDAHIVVSDRDRAELLKHAPEAHVFLIENGVETSYYSDEQIAQAYATWRAQRESTGTNHSDALRDSASVHAQPRRVVFVGSMDYHANVDAVVYFAREVWPRLFQQKPDLTFSIVGRAPAIEVQRLAALPGIEVTGTVDDVRPFYQDAVAAVIPLRVGGGSRLKILEAMAAGVPVVSTRLGAEGIAVQDGENIILAETGDELCRTLVCLAEDVERRRRVAVAGRLLVQQQYDWSMLGAALVEIYQKLVEQRKDSYRVTGE